jgi:hypothetical protein
MKRSHCAILGRAGANQDSRGGHVERSAVCGLGSAIPLACLLVYVRQPRYFGQWDEASVANPVPGRSDMLRAMVKHRRSFLDESCRRNHPTVRGRIEGLGIFRERDYLQLSAANDPACSPTFCSDVWPSVSERWAARQHDSPWSRHIGATRRRELGV